MSQTAVGFPTAAQRAVERIDARQLIALCQSAAKLSMRGSSYSYADIDDCAAQLVEQSLARHDGQPPTAEQTAKGGSESLTVQCGRAQNLRRALDRKRRKDLAAAEAAADSLSSAADEAIADGTMSAPRADADALAAAAEQRIIDNLGVARSADVLAALAAAVRGITLEQQSAADGRTIDAVKKQRQRGTRALLAAAENEQRAIRALTGGRTALRCRVEQTDSGDWQRADAVEVLWSMPDSGSGAPITLRAALLSDSEQRPPASMAREPRTRADRYADAPITTRTLPDSERRAPVARTVEQTAPALAAQQRAEYVARTPALAARPKQGEKAGQRR